MSLDSFPEQLDPQKLFARSGQITGGIKISRLTRLSEYLALSSEELQVKASLLFESEKETGYRLIRGNLQAQLPLQCQRCLEVVELSVDISLRVYILSLKDKKEMLPADAEWLQTDLSDLKIYELIEDELILGLPIVIYHENDRCNEELEEIKTQQKAEDSQLAKPFAGLAVLKQGFKDL